VHRAHVSTSPSDFAVDLFYVTDMRNELPQPERFKAVQDHVTAALQDPSSRISLHPAPVTNCRCVAAIPCDGTICGGRRAELEGVPWGGRWLVRLLLTPGPQARCPPPPPARR